MTDPELITGFENIPLVLRKSLHGMTRDQLMARPVPGRWSTHEVAIHLADADMAFAHRLKRIIAEDRPAYSAWDENAFVSRLRYEQQSADDAVTMIEVTHRQLARIFKAVDAGWLDRTGMHAERGVQTARQVLEYAVSHLSHHLKFVEERKAKLAVQSNHGS